MGNCHKWLCAPKGAGFLYARPERQSLLQPLVVSWGWKSETPGILPFQDYFGWLGTKDPASYLSVPAAIAFQREHDWDTVRLACHDLASSARQQITDLVGSEPICPDSSQWWGQMCAILLPDGDATALQQCLREKWSIEIPVISWHSRRLIRLSLQGYNSPADVERLLNRLKQALFEKRRSRTEEVRSMRSFALRGEGSREHPSPLGSVLRHIRRKNMHASGENHQGHVSTRQADLVRRSVSPVHQRPS